jgi:hypothetical protein
MRRAARLPRSARRAAPSILAYNAKAIVGLFAWKLPLQEAINLPNADRARGRVLRRGAEAAAGGRRTRSPRAASS